MLVRSSGCLSATLGGNDEELLVEVPVGSSGLHVERGGADVVDEAVVADGAVEHGHPRPRADLQVRLKQIGAALTSHVVDADTSDLDVGAEVDLHEGSLAGLRGGHSLLARAEVPDDEGGVQGYVGLRRYDNSLRPQLVPEVVEGLDLDDPEGNLLPAPGQLLQPDKPRRRTSLAAGVAEERDEGSVTLLSGR